MMADEGRSQEVQETREHPDEIRRSTSDPNVQHGAPTEGSGMVA
jgi:hypothetical protein